MAKLKKFSILLLLTILVVSSLLLIESAKAQSNIVSTYCDIYVDDVVEGQPVNVTIKMSPPMSNGESYKVFIWVTPPNPKNFSPNEPWLKSAFLTDSNGKGTATFHVPTYRGNWYVDVSFGGNGYSDPTVLYSAGHWQTQFTVYPAKTPTPIITATPSVTVSPTVSSMPSPTISELHITALITFLVAVSLLIIIVRRN